jgi:hypothetical protein
MADVKISALPAATTPLAGTELFEVVQSSTSKKVAASDIANTATNVRTVATGGTGAATLTGYVKGNGTSAMTASATIPYADVVGGPNNYGGFYDTTNQTAGANTATVVLINTTSVAGGVTVSGGSLINIPATGVYRVTALLQLSNSGAADYRVSAWIRKNGVTDITNTCVDTSVPPITGGVNGYAIVSYDIMLSLTSGEYIQFVWSTPNVGVTLEATAARTSPTRPASPSVLLTVRQIS